ncbi:MAG: sigma-70 family RNA polymerase sigma factor [Bryobacteraceae bacterium]
MQHDRQEFTVLLRQWSGGSKEAFDRLMPIVYEQLRRMASGYLRAERPDHTLRATALVHEAYLQLVDSDVAWESRLHFFAVASRVLRHILVDYARAGRRQKRGGGAEKVALEDAVLVGPQISTEILALDEALNRLAANDPRKAEIVQLIFFGGLTYDETAKLIGVSAVTVHHELKMAKAFLHSRMAAVS